MSAPQFKFLVTLAVGIIGTNAARTRLSEYGGGASAQLASIEAELLIVRAKAAELEALRAQVNRDASVPPWLTKFLEKKGVEDKVEKSGEIIDKLTDAAKDSVEACVAAIPPIVQDYEMTEKEQQRLVKKCTSINNELRVPPWLIEACPLGVGMGSFNKLEATGKSTEDPENDCQKMANAMKNPCPGLKKDTNRLTQLKEICLSFVPKAIGASASGEAGEAGEGCPAMKARIEELERKCSPEESPKEDVVGLRKQLEEATAQVEQVQNEINTIKVSGEANIEKVRETLVGVPLNIKIRELRMQTDKEKGQLTLMFSTLSKKMRDLGERILLASPEVTQMTQPDFFNFIEDTIMASDKWKTTFLKMKPCVPPMMQKGQQKSFEDSLPNLLFDTLERPAHIGLEHWSELIRLAVEGDLYLLRVLKNLGYPPVNEIKEDLYERLLSISEGKLFGPGSGYKNYVFGVRCIGQKDEE